MKYFIKKFLSYFNNNLFNIIYENNYSIVILYNKITKINDQRSKINIIEVMNNLL